MRLLVIGNGGREHAIIWKLIQSKQVTKIFCAPGNAGTSQLAENIPIGTTELEALVHFAQEEAIDLTVVGPEVPLIEGIVDRFEAVGLRAFGPKKAAAQIEGSKKFAKDMMQKYEIPTAKFQAFTDSQQAVAYVREQGAPIVIKADGVAAGKGVIVAHTVAEAEQAIAEVMDDRVFGTAGDRIVIEEFLQGQEISLMAFVDGKTMTPMVIAQDHKAVFDEDKGPNTGGMGAYSPVPQIADETVKEAIQTILYPIVEAFRQEGMEYKGVLYAGLMITDSGPRVIEFNARFGDPETQVVLPRLKSDLLDIMLSVVDGRLDELSVEWSEQSAVCVVMTAPGYPGSYSTGEEISGTLHTDANTIIFHAGTKEQDGKTVTAGGRVLGVTAIGENIASSQQKAYSMVKQIAFPNAHYREDIGYRAIGS
jgi:phosphoribosylamine---glycine ligase